MARGAAADATSPVTAAFAAAPAITTCTGTSHVTLSVTGVEPPPAQRHLDVELVLDESGSVTQSSFVQMKSGATTFADSLLADGTNELGLTQFGTVARTIFPLTPSATVAKNAIALTYQAGGNTAIGAGLQQAQNDLVEHGRAGAQRVIILETDGIDNIGTATLASTASSIRTAGTLIFAVGIGSDVDTAQLQQLASSIQGTQTLYTNPDYTQLAATLQTIAGTVEVPAGSGLSWSASALPGFTLSNASASAGSATADGSSVSWRLPTLATTTVNVSFDATYTGTTNGTMSAVGDSTLAWSDGSPESQALPGVSIAVSGCNDPPTANAGADQTVHLAGGPTASVQLDGSGSSDPDGDPLSYSWAEQGGSGLTASGASPRVTLGLGVHTFQLTVDDGRGGTATDSVVVTVDDPTPPVVTPVVTGTQHNGWYTSDVHVSFTVADPESPIASPSGCDPVTVTTDTTGQTFTCTASSAAPSPGSASVTVKRDATAPVVAFSGVQSSYALTDTVAITCSATDATSGVASATCPSLSAPAYQVAGRTLTATATDNAGNVGTASATVKVQVTGAGLCGLVQQWVANGGVANSLCVKVQHGDLDAFRNEVAAQSGKKLTADHAATLTALSRRL